MRAIALSILFATLVLKKAIRQESNASMMETIIVLSLLALIVLCLVMEW